MGAFVGSLLGDTKVDGFEDAEGAAEGAELNLKSTTPNKKKYIEINIANESRGVDIIKSCKSRESFSSPVCFTYISSKKALCFTILSIL